MSNEQRPRPSFKAIIYSEFAVPLVRHTLGVSMRQSSSHLI